MQKLPLDELLDDVITYAIANPTSTDIEARSYMMTTYGLDNSQHMILFGTLGQTLLDSGITAGLTWQDMKDAITNLGESQSRNLVALIASGVREFPIMGDVIMTLRFRRMNLRITQIDLDIPILQTAIDAETDPVLKKALESGMVDLVSEKQNLEARIGS